MGNWNDRRKDGSIDVWVKKGKKECMKEGMYFRYDGYRGCSSITDYLPFSLYATI
jgi:hypothetical protein